MVDEHGRDQINAVGTDIELAMASGAFKNATSLWSKMETVVDTATGGVNFYNILDWSGGEDYWKNVLQSTDYVGEL